MPGTPKNTNRLASGAYSKALVIGELPTGMVYVTRRLRHLSNCLTDAVMERFGKLSVTRAAAIQSACRAEMVCSLAQRWLRKHEADLAPDQKLMFAERIAIYSERRDRSIRALGLDVEQSNNVVSSLYGSQTVTDIDPIDDHDEPTPSPPAAPTSPASNAAPEDAEHG